MTDHDRHGPELVQARLEERMQSAGRRYRATDVERTTALAELKSAIWDADGHVSAQRAAELTGLPTDLLRAIQPDLRGSGSA